MWAAIRQNLEGLCPCPSELIAPARRIRRGGLSRMCASGAGGHAVPTSSPAPFLRETHSPFQLPMAQMTDGTSISVRVCCLSQQPPVNRISGRQGNSSCDPWRSDGFMVALRLVTLPSSLTWCGDEGRKAQLNTSTGC